MKEKTQQQNTQQRPTYQTWTNRRMKTKRNGENAVNGRGKCKRKQQIDQNANAPPLDNTNAAKTQMR